MLDTFSYLLYNTSMSQIETDVAEWLINHKDGLQSEITNRHCPSYHLFPDRLKDLYDDFYSDGVMKILRDKVVDSFNLNYEQIELFFTKKFVIITIGKQILEIPKE